MTTLLQAIPAEVQREHFERVDLDDSGRRIWTSAATPPKWWEQRERALLPVGPTSDPALPGAADARVATDAWLAWRPSRRAVAVCMDSGEPRIVKFLRPSRFELARQHHACAADALSRHDWRVPRLLRADADRACLEFERLRGSKAELRGTEARLSFRLGVGLREFQELGAQLDLPRRGPADELESIDRIVLRAERLAAELPAQFSTLQARLRLAAPSSRSFVLAHGDLHDGQVLIDGPRVCLLDFDSLAFADAALDAANWVAHLQLRAVQRGGSEEQDVARGLASAFLDGLDREREPGFGARLCWYQAATFLRLSAVYAMRPRWWHLTAVLVTASKRCLEDLERA